MSPISSRNSVPPSACSKRPMRRSVRAGEGAALVAEQLAFEQVLGSAAQFTLTKLRVVAERVVVDGAGDQLLARARFAADEHGRVALGHLLHDVEHALHRRARPDDAVEVVAILLRVAEVLDLVLEALHLERLVDLDLHLLDFERLEHVVERADLHRFDRGVDRAERRHQDHGRRRVQRARRPEHVHAVAAAHLEVAQHDVEVVVVEPFDRGVAVAGFLDLVPGFGQPAHEPAPQRVVIVGNRYLDPYPSFRLPEHTRCARDRQRDPEPRPGVGAAAEIDAPVVRIHDLPDDAEPQP